MQVIRHPSRGALAPAALTIGNFDGLHQGHQALLGRLREVAGQRGLAACVMSFEPHPREFLFPGDSPPRIAPLRDKLALLCAMGIDRVHLCRFDAALAATPARDFVERVLVGAHQVRYILVGDDFRFGARREGDLALLQQLGREHGFEVEPMHSVLAAGERVSSSEVRLRLAAGDLEGVQQLLGRPYELTGRIVRGQQLGRQLGYPTANVHLHSARLPLAGVFVVEVLGLGERPWPGVASLGLRPTVTSTSVPWLEVYLLDFSGELYGRRLGVRFLHKLRDEEKYPDLPTLTAQIARDVAAGRQFLSRRKA